MMQELRTYIEASDIVAIEFECTACGASTSVPLDKFQKPPIQCHVCDRQGQWLVPGAEEFSRIVRVIEGLRVLAEPNANGDRRFKLKFQIKSEKA